MEPEIQQTVAGQFSIWLFLRGLLVLLAALMGGGWVLYRWIKKSQDTPGVLVTKWIVTVVLILAAASLVPEILRGGMGIIVLMPMFAGCLILIGFLWGPNIAAAVARPLTNAFDGGDSEPEIRPCYSAAQTKRIRGHPLEAIGEVRKQLDRFPNDYDGLVLLATIQVEDLNDLPGGCLILERAIHLPGQSPGKIINALNQMADWHMKHGLDPDSARAALQRIIDLWPDTHTAQMAAQRIAHLASVEQLVQAREHTPISVPHTKRDAGLQHGPVHVVPPGSDPEEEARKLIAQLEQHPLDTEAREQLALLYAEHYQRLDLAANEIEQLIALPQEPQKHLVRWLNLLADLAIKHAADRVAAEEALRRIVDLFPNSAAAEQAGNRIACLATELSANKKSQTIPLGSYEKKLGLKKPLARDG